LPHFDWELTERRRIGERYTEQLETFCQTPAVLPGNTHVYAQYTIRVPDRSKLSQALTAQNIPTAVYYPKCLHEQPVFASLGYKWGQFPVAEQASREVLSLPMHPFLAESDQDTIVNALKALV
jgi:UDP-2-acetamido-2-deoxy-ribo-hexuluronate aminotransferase